MAIDYSEMHIGPPLEVIDELLRRLGEINFDSLNLKVGVSGHPCRAHAAQGGERAWPVMKMLYLTHSPAQAKELAGLLRAWDAKLFLDLDLEQDWPAQAGDRPGRRQSGGRRDRQSGSFYAFALIR